MYHNSERNECNEIMKGQVINEPNIQQHWEILLIHWTEKRDKHEILPRCEDARMKET